jgi:hypothetical protein
MKSKLICMLMMLLLINSGSQIFARPKVANASKNQMVRQEKIEIKYQVEAGKLMAVQGNLAACKADNDFVIAVLQSKKVELFGVDYTADVTKIVTGFLQKDNRDELIIYEYRLDIKAATRNQTLSDFISQVQAKQSLDGGLVLYGTPVTCHYVIHHGQLVLLSYYGFPKYYEKFNPDSWIADRYFRSGRK